MKKTVRVIIEKEIEIDIPDVCLTDENISQFEGYMFELETEDKREALFEYVARMAAQGYDEAEGLGQLGSKYMREYARQPAHFIVTKITVDDMETEIVE